MGKLTAKVKYALCDLCIVAFEDEGFPMEDYDDSTGPELGYLMPDHLCEQIESSGYIKCSCSGH